MKKANTEVVLLLNKTQKHFDVSGGRRIKPLSTMEVEIKEAEKLLMMYPNQVIKASEHKDVKKECSVCIEKDKEIDSLKKQLAMFLEKGSK